MKEISSGRSKARIRGREEKKTETKEEIISRGGKRDEIGPRNLHLGLGRKKDAGGVGAEPDKHRMTTFQ
jgi:hypothetical protein